MILIKAGAAFTRHLAPMVTRFPKGAEPHKPEAAAKFAPLPVPVVAPVAKDEKCFNCTGECYERDARKQA